MIDEGANSVSAVITHPVLSGPAIKRIAESPLQELIVTDTIPLSSDGGTARRSKSLRSLRCSGEAVRRINNEESVSSLFV